MRISKFHLDDKFENIHTYWDPHIVGELNGQYVKIAKIKGEFVWHHHIDEDELFYVYKGQFTMHLRHETIDLKEGEWIIIPRGTEHKPVAHEETWIVLFEPVSTHNTGNVNDERSRDELRRL